MPLSIRWSILASFSLAACAEGAVLGSDSDHGEGAHDTRNEVGGGTIEPDDEGGAPSTTDGAGGTMTASSSSSSSSSSASAGTSTSSTTVGTSAATSTSAATTGSGQASLCCDATPTPSCEDPVVASCVCLADPYCCAVAWDSTCVSEVATLGCGAC